MVQHKNNISFETWYNIKTTSVLTSRNKNHIKVETDLIAVGHSVDGTLVVAVDVSRSCRLEGQVVVEGEAVIQLAQRPRAVARPRQNDDHLHHDSPVELVIGRPSHDPLE